MKLNIKPGTENLYPIAGVLIKSPLANEWIKEIQLMGLSLSSVEVYPIPGRAANSVWGCFLIVNDKFDFKKVGKHELCQRFSPYFYIPERAMVYPSVSVPEIKQLFLNTKHVMHPAFGLVKLEEPLQLKGFIAAPTLTPQDILKPEDSIFIPTKIRSFQVRAAPIEDILDSFGTDIVPKREKFKDEPLNPVEKGRLKVYEKIFKKGKKGDTAGEGTEKTGGVEDVLAKFGKLLQGMSGGKGDNVYDKMQQDFEELERRNKKEVDKLLDLLKNNPAEGLKYAIPLDEKGTSRGEEVTGGFDLSMLWKHFGLFGNTMNTRSNSSGGGGTFELPDDTFLKLRQQYRDTAEELLRQKDYKKAAFVYLKLLKDYFLAAQTMEKGEHYEEAAAIYLKYLNDKLKAAECYEKGNMTMKAIELYIEIEKNEKVGDLYRKLNDEEKALIFYQKVVDIYLSKHQHLKASFMYRNKMYKEYEAQTVLLEGWRKRKDEFNCLNNYFSNIKDTKLLKKAIDDVYAKDVFSSNRVSFLKVLEYEYKKKNEIAAHIKEMAYEIIAAQVKVYPNVVNHLSVFTDKDKEVVKDTGRFLRR